MASWLTHMRIAEKVKQKVDGIDLPYFIMGSVAPDSGIPDESERNYTPSKEITHMRYEKADSSMDMDETEFFNKYLVPEKLMTRSDSTRSFLWGYYFHLIADKVWVEDYFRPGQKDYENSAEKPEQDFVQFIREEMLSIDFEYLEANGHELVEQLKAFDGSIGSFYEFDPEYIYECRNRIVDFYNGEPQRLEREHKYLNAQLIEEFVAKIAEKCISILVI